MNAQQPPEWSKRVITILNRLPNWAVVVGVLAFIVIGALLMMDTRQPAASPALPVGGDNPANDPTTLALGVFLRLILVVIAIYIGAMLLRRYQNANARGKERQLALLETLHLNQRRAVHLVRAGDQVFLIGSTDQTVSLIGQVTSATDGRAGLGMDDLSFSDHLEIAHQKDPGSAEAKLP